MLPACKIIFEFEIKHFKICSEVTVRSVVTQSCFVKTYSEVFLRNYLRLCKIQYFLPNFLLRNFSVNGKFWAAETVCLRKISLSGN